MNMLQRIDKCLENVDENKLSTVILNAIQLAKEMYAYEAWCILSLQTISTSDKEAEKMIMHDFCSMFNQDKLNTEQLSEVYALCFEKYVAYRILHEDKFCQDSIMQLEHKFEYYKKIDELFTDNPNLTPIDAYFEHNKNLLQKVKAEHELVKIKDIYAKVKSQVSKILGDLRIRVIEIEKKNGLNKMENDIVNSNVFIIHGHNEAKWRELKGILESDFGLIAIELSEQPNQGLTIIEKFEKYAKTCAYAFAIFTPDDIVENNGKKYFQSRPNVIFELGWFYAKLGRHKVCILDQSSEKSEIFSDLQGVLRITFNKNVQEAYRDVKNELKSAKLI